MPFGMGRAMMGGRGAMNKVRQPKQQMMGGVNPSGNFMNRLGMGQGVGVPGGFKSSSMGMPPGLQMQQPMQNTEFMPSMEMNQRPGFGGMQSPMMGGLVDPSSMGQMRGELGNGGNSDFWQRFMNRGARF